MNSNPKAFILLEKSVAWSYYLIPFGSMPWLEPAVIYCGLCFTGLVLLYSSEVWWPCFFWASELRVWRNGYCGLCLLTHHRNVICHLLGILRLLWSGKMYNSEMTTQTQDSLSRVSLMSEKRELLYSKLVDIYQAIFNRNYNWGLIRRNKNGQGNSFLHKA